MLCVYVVNVKKKKDQRCRIRRKKKKKNVKVFLLLWRLECCIECETLDRMEGDAQHQQKKF